VEDQDAEKAWAILTAAKIKFAPFRR